MNCESEPRKESTIVLTNGVNLSKTTTGGTGGMSGQVKLDAVVEVSPGWYVVSVELYSREGNDPPVWLGSMFYESTNASGDETYTAFAYEDGTGPATSAYVVEVEFMRYQSLIVSDETS